MTARQITFTVELPEHETDQCPACRSTDMFAESELPELYCRNDWHIYERELELPARWAICDRCGGDGTHVNPSIDGHGITADEWNGPDWDDESRDTYLSGGYDVPCEARCAGGRVLVPDEEACASEPLATHLRLYREQQDRAARDAAEDRRTRYMESGGREGSRW